MIKIIERFNIDMFKQVVKYGFVGVVSNLIGYLIYLILTWFFFDPKSAVSILYPIGAIISYFGHAKYSFRYTGVHSLGMLRFLLAHFIGYSVNIFTLYIFVDYLGYQHQVVQAIAIVIVASLLFVLFRFYVFVHEEFASLDGAYDDSNL